MKLEDIRIASPCQVEWDSMVGDDRTRFCNSCQLSVYNLSGMSRSEGEDLLTNAHATGKRVCVQLYRRFDGTVITEDCPVGLRRLKAVSTKVGRKIAAVVAALLWLPNPVKAQDSRMAGSPAPLMGDVAPAKQEVVTPPQQPPAIRGEAVYMPPTPQSQLNVCATVVSLKNTWLKSHGCATKAGATACEASQIGELERSKDALVASGKEALRHNLHLEAAISFNNAANCLFAQKRYAEAEALYAKALNLAIEHEKKPFATATAMGENFVLVQKTQGKKVAIKPLTSAAGQLVSALPETHLSSLAWILTANGGLQYTKTSPVKASLGKTLPKAK